MLRQSSLVFLTALLISACGGSGGSAVEGPLRLGIISGKNQTVTAGATQLPNAVVGKLVHAQTASGFRFELVKTAYAQTGPTVVNGSPVVGAVVCAVSPTPGSMVPFFPCTNTDAEGKATFFFDPGKKAGSQISEIRGLLNGQPAVFDTAHAMVMASTADPNFHTGPFPNTLSPDTVPANAVIDIYGNAVPFRIISDGRITIADTTTGAIGARIFSWTSAQITTGDFVLELRGTGGATVGHLRYHVGAGGVGSALSVAGINLTP